jgi:hypothetical protein
MATAGPNNPGTMADDASVGTRAWTNPNDAKTDNSAWALATTPTSHYLVATNFGFAVPSGATIDGIVVRFEKLMASGSGNKDNIIKLVKGGTISGTDHADTVTAWPTAVDTYVDHGGPTDLWGLSLTDSDVNASNFGVALSKVATGGFGYIDAIWITVYYTAAASTSIPVLMQSYRQRRV